MSTLTEKLEQVRDKIAAIFDGPFDIVELFDGVKALGEIVREVSPAATEEDYKVLLLEAWEWADGEWQIIERADAAITFPLVLKPAELFDGPVLRYLVEHILLPAIAGQLAKLET